MSLLDTLEPIFKMLPEIKPPATEVPLKKKLFWTAAALVLFYVMGRITLVGLEASRAEYLAAIQTVLASEMGTLISAGIGPIVLASIILQLLVGSKFLQIDLSNPKDRARFQSLQKLLAIILCFFEGFAYTITGSPLLAKPGFIPLVIGQMALGSIILLYLDELVSKYGIGSGIGLFIAGNVAASFFWQVFRPTAGIGDPGGVIMQFVSSLATGANFLLFLPIVVAVAIFLIVIFMEGMHVSIPIAVGRRGMGGRFPVKLLYVSNLPVILAVALFANIQLWTAVTEKVPIIGMVMKGLSWATNGPFNLFYNLLSRIGSEGLFAALSFMAPELLQATVYMAVLTVSCIVFGIFWVQMGGQGPEAIAAQLQRSGMYIPGFRRDQRIIEGILKKYIPTIVILGSIFVALLAGFGNMALGTISSGTGILLTVGIVYRLYEELAREQLVTMHPVLGRFFK
ncbi:MAG: preprotein translocase subunit SecY [Candidatus Diapherotrites archaeon]|nr:preprotein translocase subunit SecY [Candidatus Diapherotrites archaeon]